MQENASVPKARLVRFLLSMAVVLAVAIAGAAPAQAARNLVVGVNEDAVKSHPGISSTANDLGLGYFRVTQGWQPGQTQFSDADAASIEDALRNAGSQKILLSVFGNASAAPVTATSRTQYCSYVSNLLDRFPQIAAVNIWNEANLIHFWKVRVMTSLSPRGNDNPRARSNISHSAKTFIARMGQAYRRSHRRARIFDNWGQNVYGSSSSERPWARHRLDIGEGDYPRLLSYLKSAFGGTHQPVSRAEGRPHLVPGGRLPDRRRLKALLLREQRDRPRGCPACRRKGQPGLAADRRDQARVLSTGRRWLLQLPARRRVEPALKNVNAEVNSHRVDCGRLKKRIKSLGGTPGF